VNEATAAIARYQESGTLHLECDVLDDGVEEATAAIARY
jgi:hypothetical protein